MWWRVLAPVLVCFFVVGFVLRLVHAVDTGTAERMAAALARLRGGDGDGPWRIEYVCQGRPLFVYPIDNVPHHAEYLSENRPDEGLVAGALLRLMPDGVDVQGIALVGSALEMGRLGVDLALDHGISKATAIVVGIMSGGLVGYYAAASVMPPECANPGVLALLRTSEIWTATSRHLFAEWLGRERLCLRRIAALRADELTPAPPDPFAPHLSHLLLDAPVLDVPRIQAFQAEIGSLLGRDYAGYVPASADFGILQQAGRVCGGFGGAVSVRWGAAWQKPQPPHPMSTLLIPLQPAKRFEKLRELFRPPPAQ